MATRVGRGRGQGGRGMGVRSDNQQVSTTHLNQESMMSLLNSSNPSNSPMFSPPGSGGIIRAEFSQTDPAIAYHASNSVLQRTGVSTYAPTRGGVVDNNTSAFDKDSRRRQSPGSHGSHSTSDDTVNYRVSNDANEEDTNYYHEDDEAEEREQGRHERNSLFPTLHHTDRVRFNFINTYSQ